MKVLFVGRSIAHFTYYNSLIKSFAFSVALFIATSGFHRCRWRHFDGGCGGLLVLVLINRHKPQGRESHEQHSQSGRRFAQHHQVFHLILHVAF